VEKRKVKNGFVQKYRYTVRVIRGVSPEEETESQLYLVFLFMPPVAVAR